MQHYPLDSAPSSPAVLDSCSSLDVPFDTVTDSQRAALDAIWHQQWSSEKPFLKRALISIIGNCSIDEVIGPMAAVYLIESHEGSGKCFSLTIHGALSSSCGSILKAMLIDLLSLVEGLYKQDHSIKQVSNADIEEALGISKEESLQLATLVQCPHFYGFPFYLSGKSSDRTEWWIAPTDEVITLCQLGNSSRFLDDHLSRSQKDLTLTDREKASQSVDAAFNWDRDTSDARARFSEAEFVPASRLDALRRLRHPKFDCTRLIGLCMELNDCASRGNATAVIMLTRAILDHIPPAFGLATFQQVASNHGGRSFKQPMERLEQHTRKVADRLLHTPIRQKEVVPIMKEVGFSQELEMLLAEFCRLLKA